MPKNYHDEGILIIYNKETNLIKSSMPQIPVELYKFHTYLAYLMEFRYNISIRPSVNVSENPGFEMINGLGHLSTQLGFQYLPTPGSFCPSSEYALSSPGKNINNSLDVQLE